MITYYKEFMHFANQFTSNNLLFVVIIFTAIFSKIQEISKRSMFTAWIVFFIGTFFHEVAHFILSLITNGKPTWLSIIPHKSEDGTQYILGHVNNKNLNWKNAAFIGLAPLLLIILAYMVYLYFFNFFTPSFNTYLLYVILIVSLTTSSIPSSVDLGHIFNKKFLINIIPLVLLIALIYFLQKYSAIEIQFIHSLKKVLS